MKPYQILITLLFVSLSSYFVLDYEYSSGHFLYYFFKANIWYAIFNKIIFPVYFWTCFVLYFFSFKLFQKSSLSWSEIIGLLRNAFFFHIYLLLLTHSEEITIGFTLFPTEISPLPMITIYEQACIHVGFIAYYIFSFHYFLKSFSTRYKTHYLIFPVSSIVPYFYLESPFIHLVYSGMALSIYFAWNSFQSDKLASYYNKIIESMWFTPGIIFLLALFYRLWYAKYFASFGEGLVGFAADGPTYFKSALAFSKADISMVNFWNAPFYSFYLAGFLVLFGDSPGTVFYSQATIGSLTPVLIFLITRVLFDKRTAIIAGLLTATSHLCIHYSVVINRAAPLLITLPLIIYICLNLKENKQRLKLWGLGLLIGFSFYFGQETLLTLVMFFIYSVFLPKSMWTNRQFIKNSLWVISGILIALMPLNLLYHSYSDAWILLGRDELGSGAKTWNYNGNHFAQKMVEMGFSPIAEPDNSLRVFLNYPWKLTKLLSGKLFSEIPGFLFDPGGEFIMPLSFSMETFYGAHFQFYIYFFVFVGLFIFLLNSKLSILNKMLIIGPVSLQLLFSSLLVFGTFRFRAPISALNMILAALAVKTFFFYPESQSRLSENFSALSTMPLIQNIHAAWNQWRKIFLAGGSILLIFLIIISVKKTYRYDQFDANHNITPWITINEYQRKYTNKLELNSSVFASYNLNQETPSNDLIISFKICRFLMPGMKPYYRLAVDGKFIGIPKKIPSGCSEVKEKIETSYSKGIISLFVYASHDGKTDVPKPYSLNLLENQKKTSIRIPIIEFFLDEELGKYFNLFQNYSNGFVKISNPLILSATSSGRKKD